MNSEYIGIIETPADFCEEVRRTLEYWLAAHTDPETWASNWIADDYAYFYQGVVCNNGMLGNQFFEFDLVQACREIVAKDTADLYYQCANCGSILCNDWGDCDNEPECKDAEHQDVDPEDLADWLEEIDGNEPPADWVIDDAMQGPGFEAYRIGLMPITAPVEEEIADVLRSLDEAKTNRDLLQAAMWGSRVYHVNGEIMQDYAESAEAPLAVILSIRDNGLESVFSSEEVRTWLEEDEIPNLESESED